MHLAQSGKSSSVWRTKKWSSTNDSTTEVSSNIVAGGNLTVAAGGNVDIHASNLVSDEDMLVAAGAGANGREDASVTITAGQNTASSSYSQTKSGIGVGSGNGWVNVVGKKTVSSSTDTVENVASTLMAGGDLTVTAKQDIDIQGSVLSAGGTAGLSAGRDINVTPGESGYGADYSKTVSGIGFGASAHNGSAKAQAGYRKVSDEYTLDTTTVVPSLIQGGAGVTLNAGNDINLQAALVTSPGDITLAAGHDINMGVAYNTSSETSKHSELFIGITAQVSQNVTGAISQMKKAADTFNSGHGSTAYEVIGMASGIMQGTDALMALTNPTVSASLTIGGEGKKSSSYQDGAEAVPTQIIAGGNLVIVAGNDIHMQGTQVGADGNMLIAAGNDVFIESAQSYAASGSKESSWNVGVGIGATVSASSGSAGLRIQGGYSTDDSESRAVMQTNAHLIAGGNLTIISGNDTTIAGAVIKGTDVLLDIGNNLTIQSRQDLARSEGDGFSIGATATIGYGASGSINGGIRSHESDKAWVSEQTGIYSDGSLDIRVGNHTQIDGAVINSSTGDLKLDTGTLGFSDIQDHDKSSSYSVNINAGNDPATGKPSSAGVSGHVSDKDREQITRATVGEGEITIRKPDEQKQDVAELNRDVDKAQEITKDESSGVEFYASTSAINEIASGFETTQNNLKTLEKAAQNIPETIQKSVSQAAAELDFAGKSLSQAISALAAKFAGENSPESKVLKEILDSANSKQKIQDLIACANSGGGKTGFNLLNLFVTPAYAATPCGTIAGQTLTPELAQRCIALAQEAASAVAGADLAALGRRLGPLNKVLAYVMSSPNPEISFILEGNITLSVEKTGDGEFKLVIQKIDAPSDAVAVLKPTFGTNNTGMTTIYVQQVGNSNSYVLTGQQ